MPTNRTAAGLNPILTSDLSGAPVAGDSVYCGNGAVDYNAGLDLTATDLLNFVQTAGHSGNMGTASTPLKVVCDQGGTGKCIIGGSGQTCYLASSSGAGVIAKLYITPAAGARCYVGASAVGTLYALASSTQVSDQATVTTCVASGSAQVQLLKNGPATTTVTANDSSQVDLARACTTININNSATVNVLVDTITPTVNLNGGRCNYAGGNATFVLNSGKLDLTKITKPLALTRTVNGKVEIIISRNAPTITWTATDNVEPQITYV